MSKLTHLDQKGAARMVDVSGKAVTARDATAEALVVMSAEAYAEVAGGEAPKGDVLATARIAGIMAAKKTHELIPLCHPLPLSRVAIEFEFLTDRLAVRILGTTKTAAQTGVEMEALTAVALAALTIYDMIKAVDRSAVIEHVRLLAKSGGKSGEYRAQQKAGSARPAKAQPLKATARPLPESGPISPRAATSSQREAFRQFMSDRSLRATEWAKRAGVPASHIYAYLTGRAPSLPVQSAEKLADALSVRPEDMFAEKPR